MALHRRRFLQKRVDSLLKSQRKEDRMFTEDTLTAYRAEIKWLRYVEREITGRGRVRK